MKLEDVVPAARALLLATSERAEKTEAERRLLPEAERDLRDAGMFKLLQPRRYGGFELDPVAIVRATSELARGCGSTGWCLGVLATHSWMLGLYEQQAQQDVWGEDPEDAVGCLLCTHGRGRAGRRWHPDQRPLVLRQRLRCRPLDDGGRRRSLRGSLPGPAHVPRTAG